MIGQRGQGRVDLRLRPVQGQRAAPVRPCTDRRPARQAHAQGPVRHRQLRRAQVAVHVRDAEAAERQRRIFRHRLRPRHRVHRRIVGLLDIDQLRLRCGRASIPIGQPDRECAGRGGWILADIVELDAPIDFLNARWSRIGIERNDQRIGSARSATHGADHDAFVGHITAGDPHLTWTSAPVPHDQAVIGRTVGGDRDGHHTTIEVRRIHIGHSAGRIDELCHATFHKGDIRCDRREHRRIVDGCDGDIHRVSGTREGGRAPVARCAHLRPRRAAGLIPRSHRQGRAARPVVIGARREIQPRAPVIRQ